MVGPDGGASALNPKPISRVAPIGGSQYRPFEGGLTSGAELPLCGGRWAIAGAASGLALPLWRAGERRLLVQRAYSRGAAWVGCGTAFRGKGVLGCCNCC